MLQLKGSGSLPICLVGRRERAAPQSSAAPAAACSWLSKQLADGSGARRLQRLTAGCNDRGPNTGAGALLSAQHDAQLPGLLKHLPADTCAASVMQTACQPPGCNLLRGLAAAAPRRQPAWQPQGRRRLGLGRATYHQRRGVSCRAESALHMWDQSWALTL